MSSATTKKADILSYGGKSTGLIGHKEALNATRNYAEWKKINAAMRNNESQIASGTDKASYGYGAF